MQTSVSTDAVPSSAVLGDRGERRQHLGAGLPVPHAKGHPSAGLLGWFDGDQRHREDAGHRVERRGGWYRRCQRAVERLGNRTTPSGRVRRGCRVGAVTAIAARAGEGSQRHDDQQHEHARRARRIIPGSGLSDRALSREARLQCNAQVGRAGARRPASGVRLRRLAPLVHHLPAGRSSRPPACREAPRGPPERVGGQQHQVGQLARA